MSRVYEISWGSILLTNQSIVHKYFVDCTCRRLWGLTVYTRRGLDVRQLKVGRMSDFLCLHLFMSKNKLM